MVCSAVDVGSCGDLSPSNSSFHTQKHALLVLIPVTVNWPLKRCITRNCCKLHAIHKRLYCVHQFNCRFESLLMCTMYIALAIPFRFRFGCSISCELFIFKQDTYLCVMWAIFNLARKKVFCRLVANTWTCWRNQWRRLLATLSQRPIALRTLLNPTDIISQRLTLQIKRQNWTKLNANVQCAATTRALHFVVSNFLFRLSLALIKSIASNETNGNNVQRSSRLSVVLSALLMQRKDDQFPQQTVNNNLLLWHRTPNGEKFSVNPVA